MAEVTVKQLAEMVGVSVDRLLEQMKEAGISGKNDGAAVSEPERQTLQITLSVVTVKTLQMVSLKRLH